MWEFFNQWGNAASVIGLLLSVIGFAATLVTVYKAKNAAQQAKEAAKEVMTRVLTFDTIAAFTEAISALQEIMRLHRMKAWHFLPDRYSTVRGLLISVRTSHKGLDEHGVAILTSAVTEISAMHGKVEKALAKNSGFPDPARFNSIIHKQLESLIELQSHTRQTIGGKDG